MRHEELLAEYTRRTGKLPPPEDDPGEHWTRDPGPPPVPPPTDDEWGEWIYHWQPSRRWPPPRTGPYRRDAWAKHDDEGLLTQLHRAEAAMPPPAPGMRRGWRLEMPLREPVGAVHWSGPFAALETNNLLLPAGTRLRDYVWSLWYPHGMRGPTSNAGGPGGMRGLPLPGPDLFVCSCLGTLLHLFGTGTAAHLRAGARVLVIDVPAGLTGRPLIGIDDGWQFTFRPAEIGDLDAALAGVFQRFRHPWQED